MEFLSMPLPESIVDCEKQGLYKLAEQKIKGFLDKEIPDLLRSRLEYELYRLSRVRKNYLFEEDGRFNY